MSRNCLFGFRNRKFAPGPVEQGAYIILGAYIIFAIGQIMSLNEPRQMEETKIAIHVGKP
jgi:hypothetical protein